MTAEELNELSKQVLDAAFAAQTEPGPGLFASTQVACLKDELEKRRLAVMTEVPVPVAMTGTS